MIDLDGFKQKLSQLPVERVVGFSGLAILSAASFLSFIPPASEGLSTALAQYLSNVGLNVFAGVLQANYQDLLSQSNAETEKLANLAEIITKDIKRNAVLRRELGTYLGNIDAFKIAEEVVNGNQATHGWLLVKIYADVTQYRKDFEHIHLSLAEIKSSVQEIYRLTVDKSTKEDSDILLKVQLEERQNLQVLKDAIYRAESIYAVGKLPKELAELLYSATRFYETARYEHGLQTTLMRYGDLQERKESVYQLTELVTSGERFIFDVMTNELRPAYEVLQEAILLYEQLSADITRDELDKANLALPHLPIKARNRLREVLQQPLLEMHRRILDEKMDQINRLVNQHLSQCRSFLEQELTKQEREIVLFVACNGWMSKQIVENSNLPLSVVDMHLEHICQKLKRYFGLRMANLGTISTIFEEYCDEKIR